MTSYFSYDELIIDGIDFNLILSTDFEGYKDWIFTHLPITRKYKKEQVEALIERHGKTIANYREFINLIFIKTTYWIPPSEHEKNSFSIWRKDSFEREVFFNTKQNFTSIKYQQLKEIERMAHILGEGSMGLILYRIINSQLNVDYYDLARFYGLIDHIKNLLLVPNSCTEIKSGGSVETLSKQDKKQPGKKTKFDAKEIVLICIFKNRKINPEDWGKINEEYENEAASSNRLKELREAYELFNRGYNIKDHIATDCDSAQAKTHRIKIIIKVIPKLEILELDLAVDCIRVLNPDHFYLN